MPQGNENGSATARYSVLGMPLDAIQIDQVIARMQAWIDAKAGTHIITVNALHSVLAAYDQPEVMTIQNSADLCVPDGKPLILLGRWRGHHLPRRVYGPELMATFHQLAGAKPRQFYYGGLPGVAEQLARVVADRWQAQVVGTLTPSMTPLAGGEVTQALAAITAAKADVVWVGLPSPTQERLMAALKKQGCQASVMVGVGAAFDFLAGTKPQAPRWLGDAGFEWLYRLLSEPRRLAKRYFIGGFRFIYLIIKHEILRL